jgi:hypothetical protein
MVGSSGDFLLPKDAYENKKGCLKSSACPVNGIHVLKVTRTTGVLRQPLLDLVKSIKENRARKQKKPPPPAEKK